MGAKVSSSGCSVIINRLSGTYSAKKVERVRVFLEEQGLCPRFYFLRDFDEVTLVTRRICAEYPNPLIIVGGGDGTINGVLNGLSPGVATLAVLPFGTSNVLTRELGIHSVEDALQRIAIGESRPAFVGRIETEAAHRYFLLMAGIGFDGFVVHGVRIREKKLLGKAAYVLSALRHLIHWEPHYMAVTAGGRKLECHSLIVCNAAKYAGDFLLAPGASLFDPEFEVVCFRETARTVYLKAAIDLLKGRGLQGDDICTFRTGELSVAGEKPIQIDGDYFCHTPVKISILPGFVKLIV
jgi:diacylglycerol kinase (ATP)